MLRTHTCGELRLTDVSTFATLCGWVQIMRDKGGIIYIDLRDRYGLTQLILNEKETSSELIALARTLGREFVIQASGKVVERFAKNDKILTGAIEIQLSDLKVLNPAQLPPFLIQDETDGGDDLRMKYRYLDLRRNSVRRNLELRHQISRYIRNYLDDQQFIEVETPVLIKSTPEGARDFVVPSRMNPGEFYALPQSPQTFKQLLMVSGFDRYYQIVKCFRDEDLRADRQPEFTQIDCEMSFIEQEDILQMFEGLIRHVFKHVKNLDLQAIPRITYDEAMQKYGSDKPDIRFGMEFCELKNETLDLTSGKNFQVLDSAELVVGICVKNGATFTRKQIDEWTEFVKKPQVGAKGLIYARVEDEIKSSVDKFYSAQDLQKWANQMHAEKGDLLLILAGETNKTRKQLNELRLEIGNHLGLRNSKEYKVLWVLDFPLLEYSEDENRYFAMHHPFTSPKPDDIHLLNTNELGKIRANAYDMVINGVEVGGGSIRIFDKKLQAQLFEVLGFTAEEAQQQFGFLMDAFQYGAPPHGGIAFGFDRLCSLLGEAETIRDFIAFPKNNSGRDTMIDAPSPIDDKQLKELKIKIQ